MNEKSGMTNICRVYPLGTMSSQNLTALDAIVAELSEWDHSGPNE